MIHMYIFFVSVLCIFLRVQNREISSFTLFLVIVDKRNILKNLTQCLEKQRI